MQLIKGLDEHLHNEYVKNSPECHPDPEPDQDRCYFCDDDISEDPDKEMINVGGPHDLPSCHECAVFYNSKMARG